MRRLSAVWKGFTRWLAWLNGDAAYQASCQQFARAHGEGCEHKLPTRGEFFRAEQERRWSGIRRCC